MIYKVFGAVFFLFFSSLAMSNDTLRDAKNVVGVFNFDTNTPVNTRDVYGDVIYYYIPENIRDISIMLPDGGRVSIDLESEIENAITAWSDSGLRFIRVNSNVGLTRYIGYRLGDTTHGFGHTNFNQPRDDDAITRVAISPLGLAAGVPRYYHGLRAQRRIPQDMDIADFMRMWVRLTVLHETGHALGLAHHDEDNREMPGVGIGRMLVQCSTIFSRPSIMVSGATGSYINFLSQYLSRPVTIRDVMLSRNDLEGADRMFSYRTSLSGLFSLMCIALLSSQSYKF